MAAAARNLFRTMVIGLLVIAWSAMPPAWSAAATEPANLVANGDFAKAADGKPNSWQTAGNPKDVDQTLTVVPDSDGRLYAKLACTRCDRRTAGSHAMLAQVGQVKLAQGHLYEFSCRLRQEGIRSRIVSIALSDTKDWSNAGLSEQVAVGSAWKTYRRFFQAAHDIGLTGRLQLWYTEPGTLFVADVQIAPVGQTEVAFTDLAPASGGKNLVYNGSFEVGSAGWSSLGKDAGWGNLDQLHGQVEETGGTNGKCFLRIPMGGEKTPLLHFDYFEPVARRELRPLAASRGWIRVEPGAAYTLSCDMRASVEGTPALIGARAKDPAQAGWNEPTRPVQLTTAWKRYSFTFKPGRPYLFVFAGPNLTQDQRVDVDIDAVQLEKGQTATAYEPSGELEYALSPSAPGGIFEAGQPGHLVLRAYNHGAAPADTTVRFTVTDFQDRPVPLPDAQVKLPTGSPVEVKIPIPPQWRGFYRVRAAPAPDGRLVPPQEVRLAIVPVRSSGDSVCGVNHAFNSPYLIGLAKLAGVTWYRDWTLKWQHMEPTRGQFHWEIGDEQIDRVLKEGVHVLPLLPPFPSSDWAADAPTSLPATGYPGIRLRQAFPPKDPAEMGRFIEQAASRYKDRIHVWEFLNEPIYTSYALPDRYSRQYGGNGYTPADYVALLKVAAAAMRKADSACKVMGGIAGGPEELTGEVIEAGCLDQVDIFNLHIYPGQRPPESYIEGMDRLLALMDRHGGRKPVWITEFSYYATDDLPRRPFFPQANSWAEERLLESERQCAEYTVRFFVVMLSRGVEKIFIHSGAGGRVNDPNYECALFDYGGAPRKLLPALAVFTEMMGARPKAAGFRKLGESGYAAAFETGQQAVVVAWSDQPEEKPIAIAAAAGADTSGLTTAEFLGQKSPAAFPIALSGSPVYLLGPSGRARQMLETLDAADIRRPASLPAKPSP